MEKGVSLANFESFAKAKYKQQRRYQHTTIKEFHIFSAKSTLLATSRPFQTQDRIQNMFKFLS